jgi:ribA/ribD-fused uncharacterized protein
MLPPPIDQFVGDYRWLSNFEFSDVFLDGLQFRTVEHAYQASKFTDQERRIQIQHLLTPGEAKAVGKTTKPSPAWEARKIHTMHELLVQKFHQQPFHSKLLATGSRKIIEGNTWGDTFWGVYKGEGKNWLGVLIMCIRDRKVPEFPKASAQQVSLFADHG